jgi:hypothetical protein
MRMIKQRMVFISIMDNRFEKEDRVGASAVLSGIRNRWMVFVTPSAEKFFMDYLLSLFAYLLV